MRAATETSSNSFESSLVNGRKANGRHEYDAIVIGSGQGGGPLAGALAKAGRRVALVEQRHVGGTCVNVGCTPTKAMIASADVANAANRAQAYGVMAGGVRVDLASVRERKRAIVESFREGSRSSLEKLDTLDLIFARARFDGPRRIRVERDGMSEMLESPMIFLDTGARPAKLDIPGIDEVEQLDSTSIMELTHLPNHLLVVGGGYVGVEFAQMFRRFGSEVTIVQRGPQLLRREDHDVSAELEQLLRDDGIRIMTGAGATRVSRVDGTIELTVTANGDEQQLSGSDLLVAIGRRPNTDGLGLDEAGVSLDERGHVIVDDRLRTTAEGVWALGDVKGGPAFTHISYDDYRILRGHLLRDEARTTRERPVPYTIFTDPQLGRVGMTEVEALESGRRIGIAKVPATRIARAIETGNDRGVWKALVDLDTEEILGAAILGQEGGEVMAVLQVAMMGGLSYKSLRDGVFAHPTYAESLNNLFARIEELTRS